MTSEPVNCPSEFKIGERVYAMDFREAQVWVHEPLNHKPPTKGITWLQWKDGEVHPVNTNRILKYRTREELDDEIRKLRAMLHDQ